MIIGRFSGVADAIKNKAPRQQVGARTSIIDERQITVHESDEINTESLEVVSAGVPRQRTYGSRGSG
jgi:hypothetical protein